MTIQEQLREDMKTAMKARDQVRLDAIRYLMSRIKNVEIDAGLLDDTAVQQVVSKVIKEARESIVEYEKAGREELAQAEQAKMHVLEEYLPTQLSDVELRALIAESIKAQPDLAFGQLIGAVNKQVAGRADGSRVAALVKDTLAK
ncbi:MAG: GatB/YqeY domain-containing protein [Patescibacteria group bacterium]